MNDAARVGGGEAARDLGPVRGRLATGQRARPGARARWLPRSLTRMVGKSGSRCPAHVAPRATRGSARRLAARASCSKRRKPVGVAGQRTREDFHRDVAIQARVPRAVHLAHPPAPSGPRILVRPECARRGRAPAGTLTARWSGSRRPARVSGQQRDSTSCRSACRRPRTAGPVEGKARVDWVAIEGRPEQRAHARPAIGRQAGRAGPPNLRKSQARARRHSRVHPSIRRPRARPPSPPDRARRRSAADQPHSR